MAANPLGVWEAGVRFAGRLSGAAAGMAARALGAKPKPELLPAPKDRRFRDPAWDENPWFFGERQAYLAWAHLVHELVTAGGLDKRSEDKAAFALGLLVDAMAPTNFLMTNPAALRKAAETHGMSLVVDDGKIAQRVGDELVWLGDADAAGAPLAESVARQLAGVRLDTVAAQGEDLASADNTLPGLLGIILLFHGMQSSLSMVYDREMGVMRLLLTAPSPWITAP